MTTSAVLQKQLTYLKAQFRRKYRPLRWRSLVPKGTGIPTWAEKIEVYQLKEYGNEPVAYQDGGQNKAPVPTFDRSSGSLGVFEFALAYQIFNTELARAAQTGINVTDVKVSTNARSFEEFFEKIAAVGTTPKLSANGIRIGHGLLRGNDNSVGVPVLAAGADNSGFPIYVLDDSATDQECLDTVGNLIHKVVDNSKEFYNPNLVVLPDDKFRYLAKRKVEDGSGSVLNMIREAYPGVRIEPWYKARTAGGTLTNGVGSSNRAMAVESTNDVVEFMMVEEPHDDEPLKIHRGYEVLQTTRFAGVTFWNPTGAAYADGV